MPRTPRTVFPGIPHFARQEGNNRDRVYFAPGDPEAYLDLLRMYARRAGLAVLAYCLMPNHVDLVAVPSGKDSLEKTLRPAHSQYAQRVNRMRGRGGHLWRGRYDACALDTAYCLDAIRYVELNPVAAGLVQHAADYRWSSAAAHCGLRADPLLAPVSESTVLKRITNWPDWLLTGVPDDRQQLLQRNSRLGLPCGSEAFVEQLENLAGRQLRYRAWGGRRK